jgi:di/tricarboxylate transporter
VTPEIAIVLGLLVLAVILFARETVPVDFVTLLALAMLVLTGVLTPSEAFSGFSSEIIIILASIFVITGALQQTGVVEALGERLQRLAGNSPVLLILMTMVMVSFISAFMNNTTATALFIAPVTAVARRMKLSPSKVLMPLAFASMLGGTCTLIGTSTNVAVNGFLVARGHEPLRLFEITPLGVIAVGAGLAYMILIGRHLLPDRGDDRLTDERHLREYLSEIVVVPGSHLIGQRIEESELARMNFLIVEIARGREKMLPGPQTRIESGDTLLVRGNAADLMKVKQAAGIEIKPELKLAANDSPSDNIKIGEALINPRSEMIGRTLRQVAFRQRFGLTVLAIYRHGQPLRDSLVNLRLRLGDVLLVQGRREDVEALRGGHDLTLLNELRPALYRQRRGLLVAGSFIAALALGGLGVLPLSVALMLAAVACVLGRALPAEETYGFVDWRLLVLIGGMTSFGVAMQKSGAAEFLADWMGAALGPLGPHGMLAGFLLLTMLLSQPLSNAAAALVVLPVALATAQDLGANERSFAIAVMLGASLSFITPLEPSCILVYGPGKYRFADFVKVGLGLTLLLAVIVIWLIPRWWPLGLAGN